MDRKPSSDTPHFLKSYFYNYVFKPEGALGYGFSFVAGYWYY